MSLLGRAIKIFVREFINYKLERVHTHLPAQVISYDSEKNTCSIQPCIKVFRTTDTVTGESELPVLEDIPVQFAGAGDVVLTVPVKAGTYGYYHIAEDDLNQWLSEGGTVSPTSVDRFNLDTGVFEPGLYPFDSSFSSAVQTDRISMRTKDGTTHVSVVEDNTVEINGSADFAVAYDDLKSAFDTLKSDFNALVTAYNAHIHVTTATIGVGPAVGVISPTTSTGSASTADMSGAKVTTVKLP